MAKKQEQKLIINQLVVKAPTRQVSDIDTWRTALQSADLGRPRLLFDLFEDLLIDGVLSDAFDKRLQAVTNSPITFQNEAGEEVDDVTALIDTTAFEDLLIAIMHQIAWGRSGGELDFTAVTPDGKPAFNFYEFPAKHIKLENSNILVNAYDETGFPYENDDHILVLGKVRQFGLLLKAAPYAIWKRGGFGDYAQWLELFGMPQRVGKYSSYDPESRRLLEAAMEAAGSAPWIVIPKETDVETVAQSSQGDGGSYNEFRRACNEEILITILGQTLTTMQNETGARSLGEVHKQVEEGKNRSDLRYVQRILNNLLVPMLEKRGFPVKGGKFVFPDSAEELSVQDVVQLSEILEIPSKFLHEKYSIPIPEDGEPIARRAASPVMFPPVGDIKDDTEDDTDNDTEDDAEDDTEDDNKTRPGVPPVPKVRQSKFVKNSDTLVKRLFSFFVGAPAQGATQTIILTDVTKIINIRKLFLNAVSNLYESRGRTGNVAGIDPDLFTIGNTVLQNALSGTFEQAGADWNKQNEDFTKQFSENTAVFNAFKNHQQTADIVKLLYNDDGSIRPFSEFKKLALQISNGYNQVWLQTEYNTAVRGARMAVNWKKFQEKKHLYPNLEYMPSRAANPRDSHRKLWHCVFAIDDPIWDTIMPPSDWNCLCGVRQTTREVTPLPGDFEWPKNPPEFRNNPGKTAMFVDTKETGYYQGTDQDLRAEVIAYAFKTMLG